MRMSSCADIIELSVCMGPTPVGEGERVFLLPPWRGTAALNEAALRRRSRGERGPRGPCADTVAPRLEWGGKARHSHSTGLHPHPDPPPSRGRMYLSRALRLCTGVKVH